LATVNALIHFINNLVSMLSMRQDWWPFAFWVPFFLVILLLAYLTKQNHKLDGARRLFPVAGLLMILLFGWFNYVFLFSPVYLGPMSHIQPLIADVSWYFASGKPVYHGPDSVEVYNILYGPWLFIFAGWCEQALGPSVFSAKLGGELALLVTLVVLFELLRKRAGAGFAITGVGIFAAIIMALDPVEILVRTDVYITLFVLVGCWAAGSSFKAAPYILGLMLGLCVNLKIHGGVYFLPLAWLAWQSGWRSKQSLTVAMTALITAIFPFLVFSNVSLRNYLWTLGVAGSQGINLINLFTNIEWFFLLCVPLAAVVALASLRDAPATARALKSFYPMLLLILVEFLAILPFASKYGAGPHHYLPLSVVLLLLGADLHAQGVRWVWGTTVAAAGVQAACFSWLASCLGTGLVRCYQDTAWLQGRTNWAHSIESDLHGITAKYGADHVILMGVGNNDDYEQTFFRSELVFAGQPIGIEPSALMESAFTGRPTPPLDQLIKTFGQDYPGRKIMWLIPKGNAPFSLESYYAETHGSTYGEHDLLFDAAFRAGFQSHFSLMASTSFYDLYSN
jgi:hypothetical protein